MSSATRCTTRRRACRCGGFGKAARELAVVLRDHCIGWEERRVGKLIATGEYQRLQVHGAGHQHQAGQCHTDVQKFFGKDRSPRRAVTFAGDIERRTPPSMTTEPGADSLRQRIRIAIH
jgi:hypothetical protein